jgi:predicted amidophosphoribosyltransferase
MQELFRFTDFISDKLRLCPICYHKAEPHRLLCSRCAHYGTRYRYRQWARWQGGVPILSLFEWSDNAHGFFQAYAAGLKGGGPAAIYRGLAADLLVLRAQLKKPQELSPCRPWTVIPVPGPGGWRRDHAEELAWQIAALSGARYMPCMRRISGKSQKRKKLGERWASAGVKLLPSMLGRDESETVYILVDDVITTGSTAENVHRLLGRPKNFEVWTLFNRPRLRGRA